MSERNDFVYQTARPLPVILLLDASGSMGENGKITALNLAVREMLSSFRRFDVASASISADDDSFDF